MGTISMWWLRKIGAKLLNFYRSKKLKRIIETNLSLIKNYRPERWLCRFWEIWDWDLQAKNYL